MKSWTDTYWLMWLVGAVLIGFGIPEFLAISDGDPDTDPLTVWVVARGFATAAAITGAWLFVHFWRRRRR